MGELVVARGDAPPVLEPAPHALDEVAIFIGRGVIGDGPSSCEGGRNDGLDAALGEAVAEMVGVIPSIGDEPSDGPRGIDQGGGQADVVGVAAAQQQDAGAASVVDQPVQLGGPSPARTTYPLEEVPPFAPAAERCALTWVASMEAEL